MITKDIIKNNEYWNSYYARPDMAIKNVLPSQFAAFCLAEMKEMGIANVVEIASGDGRDAIFFADHGVQVLATDSSTEAVKLLKSKFFSYKNIKVVEHDATKSLANLVDDIKVPCAFYARFFLHTLSNNRLRDFLENLSIIMKSRDFLFIEYRNENDALKPKVTGAHFRAFHGAETIAKLAEVYKLRVVYEVSGKGFAKWKHDDAEVTRQILQYKE